jgi:hypothetical protein
MEERKKGLYLGTEVVGKRWFKRYLKDKLFARGNGVYWTKHAGRWAMGNLIVKIIWRKHELTLSSGFFVSKKGEDAMILRAELERRIHEDGKA